MVEELLKLKRRSETPKEERFLEGTALSYGAVVGQAHFYKVLQHNVATPEGPINREAEQEKLTKGLKKLRASISEMIARTAVTLTEESLEIFDVYRLLAQDPIFEREMHALVQDGRSALEATEIVEQKFQAKMKQDAFWKARFYDLQYLLRKLRTFILEIDEEAQLLASQDRLLILIAPYISPADLLQAHRYQHVVGLVLKDDSQISHTAILARSLHIPTLGGVSLTPELCPPGARLLLDAYASKLYIHPSPSTLEQIQRKTVLSLQQSEDLPHEAVTRDGVKIDLLLSANLETDFSLLPHPIIKGVGLFRTEILLMSPEISSNFHTQVEEYQRVFDRAGDKPVVFRTIDMVDDKEAETFTQTDLAIKRLPETQKARLKEDIDPGLHLVLETSTGKILINRYQFIRTQIRALLRARTRSQNPHGPVYIMTPMIADFVELKAYQKIIESEALNEALYNPAITSQIKYGVMVEVPSLVYQIDKLKHAVDFVAIGTNDLFQYFFATSRWDTKNRRSQDILSPTFLKFLGHIIHQFLQIEVATHVCGEMAAQPLAAMALLGLGMRQLSVSPSAVYPIAKMINSLPLGVLYPYLRPFRVESYEFSTASTEQYNSSVDVRYTLQKFAHEFGVSI